MHRNSDSAIRNVSSKRVREGEDPKKRKRRRRRGGSEAKWKRKAEENEIEEKCREKKQELLTARFSVHGLHE